MEIQSLTVSERIVLAEALWDSVAAKDSEIALTKTQKAESVSYTHLTLPTNREV